MNISNYLEEQLIKHTLGEGAYTSVATTHAAILSALADDGTTVTEFSGSNYTRQPIAAAKWDAPIGGVTTNNVDIAWPAATADWGNARYIGIYDSDTNGNLLWWGQLTVAKAVSTSAIFTIEAGDLDVSALGAFGLYARNGVLDLTLRNTAFASPANVYAGIGTVVGSSNDSLSEPSAGYARVQVTSFTKIANGVYEITGPTLNFVAAGANWGTMTHLGLFDGSGNLLYALEMSPSRAIFDGDGVRFTSGNVIIRVQ